MHELWPRRTRANWRLCMSHPARTTACAIEKPSTLRPGGGVREMAHKRSEADHPNVRFGSKADIHRKKPCPLCPPKRTFCIAAANLLGAKSKRAKQMCKRCRVERSSCSPACRKFVSI